MSTKAKLNILWELWPEKIVLSWKIPSHKSLYCHCVGIRWVLPEHSWVTVWPKESKPQWNMKTCGVEATRCDHGKLSVLSSCSYKAIFCLHIVWLIQKPRMRTENVGWGIVCRSWPETLFCGDSVRVFDLQNCKTWVGDLRVSGIYGIDAMASGRLWTLGIKPKTILAGSQAP